MMLWNMMSPEERRSFPINVKNVDWKLNFEGYVYGIRRFYLKEDCLSPVDDFK